MKKRNYLTFQAAAIGISFILYASNLDAMAEIEEANNIIYSITNPSTSLNSNNKETNLPETLTREEFGKRYNDLNKKEIILLSHEEFGKRYESLNAELRALNKAISEYPQALLKKSEYHNTHLMAKQHQEQQQTIYKQMGELTETYHKQNSHLISTPKNDDSNKDSLFVRILKYTFNSIGCF